MRFAPNGLILGSDGSLWGKNQFVPDKQLLGRWPN